MVVRYLLDENVAAVLAVGLRQHAPELVVWAVGDPGAPPPGTLDPAILRCCDEHDFVLVTNNRRTMSVHLAAHLGEGRHVPGIVVFSPRLNLSDTIENLHAAHRRSPGWGRLLTPARRMTEVARTTARGTDDRGRGRGGTHRRPPRSSLGNCPPPALRAPLLAQSLSFSGGRSGFPAPDFLCLQRTCGARSGCKLRSRRCCWRTLARRRAAVGVRVRSLRWSS